MQLGVDPENCVVVEDAAAGVQAARLAGVSLTKIYRIEAFAAAAAAWPMFLNFYEQCTVLLCGMGDHLSLIIEWP